ncbi:TPA: hypothetical protein ACSCYS_004215 [Aeromonas veronii]
MSQTTGTQELPVSYFIEAYTPNPNNSDSFFSYSGEVTRSKLINSGDEYAFFLKGLADYFFSQTGVKCLPGSIRLHRMELLRDDLFPIKA